MKKCYLKNEEIVRRFFSSDRSQIDSENFILRFTPKIKKQIRDLTLRKDETEDFCHDVVERLLNLGAGDYEEKGSFDAWLAKVVHNLYVTKMKKELRPIDLLRYEMKMNNMSYIKRDKLKWLVRETMKELTDIQRRTIEMVFFEKLRQKEICKREGIGLNTHNKRLSRAKKNLESCCLSAESLTSSRNNNAEVT